MEPAEEEIQQLESLQTNTAVPGCPSTTTSTLLYPTPTTTTTASTTTNINACSIIL